MFAALGIILLVAGAVLAYAVEAESEGFDLVTIGWILMAGGAVSLVVAMIQGAGLLSRSNMQVHAERHRSADGRVDVEDVETS